MDTPNPVPAVKAAPGKLGKAIKGHKPVVYVGVVTLALILAWYIRKREQDAAITPTPENVSGSTLADPLSTADGYAAYGGAATYDGSQGAAGGYYGYSDPTLGGQTGFSVQDLTDLIGALGSYQQYAPMPYDTPAVPTGPAAATAPPTGGGPQARINPGIVHAVPKSATAVATIPKGGTSTTIHDHPTPPNPAFPYLSTRGWYRVDVNPKGHKPGRYHVYANGLFEKVG